MLTTDAFAKLLNLQPPWSIERMENQESPAEAHVWVAAGRGPHAWLYGQLNLPRHLLAELAQLVASDLKTAKAWTVKEHLRHLWAMTSVDTARDYAIAWARAATDTD